VQFFDGALRFCKLGDIISIPLNPRLLPLLPRRQHLLLIPTDLRLHHFELRADQ